MRTAKPSTRAAMKSMADKRMAEYFTSGPGVKFDIAEAQSAIEVSLQTGRQPRGLPLSQLEQRRTPFVEFLYSVQPEKGRKRQFWVRSPPQ